jgi:hypothetical protein
MPPKLSRHGWLPDAAALRVRSVRAEGFDMSRAEFDLICWLAEEHRPVTHLVALPADALSAWIRAHGGKAKHVDAACYLRMRLQSRFSDRIAVAGNVVRITR